MERERSGVGRLKCLMILYKPTRSVSLTEKCFFFHSALERFLCLRFLDSTKMIFEPRSEYMCICMMRKKEFDYHRLIDCNMECF